MLKTCDEGSIVYIDYNGDINSIDEVCDYSNNCGEVIIVRIPEDIDNFIKSESCTTAGKKTTIGVLTCLTGFEATVSSSCVKPENYDINIGKKYAIEKAKDQIWSGLGFVLQWAINGLKKK